MKYLTFAAARQKCCTVQKCSIFKFWFHLLQLELSHLEPDFTLWLLFSNCCADYFCWVCDFCLRELDKVKCSVRSCDINKHLKSLIFQKVEDQDLLYFLYRCLRIWNFRLSYFHCPCPHFHGSVTTWKKKRFIVFLFSLLS